MKMGPNGCPNQARQRPLSRRRMLGAAAGMAFALSACDRRAADTIGQSGNAQTDRVATEALSQVQAEVWKTPSCGCCKAWVKHLQDNGFRVLAHDVPDTAPKRAELGMPAKLASCHTARIGNYTVEGHVPATDIKRLLTESRHAIGLAVPGMPIGSPGMEQGSQRDKFDVLLVLHDGATSVFQSHP
jgi:hypothetical protein